MKKKIYTTPSVGIQMLNIESGILAATTDPADYWAVDGDKKPIKEGPTDGSEIEIDAKKNWGTLWDFDDAIDNI